MCIRVKGTKGELQFQFWELGKLCVTLHTILLISVCVCVSGRSLFSSSVVCVLGIKFRLPGLAASATTHWAIKILSVVNFLFVLELTMSNRLSTTQPGWPWTHREPPASASWDLVLQAWTTTASFLHLFLFLRWGSHYIDQTWLELRNLPGLAVSIYKGRNPTWGMVLPFY